MKTVLTSILALVAAASIPASADRSDTTPFSYNPNESVAEIYVDLAKTAETVCEARYKDSAIRGVWGTAVASCERELLNDVVAQIGNPQLAALHNDDTRFTGGSFAEIRDPN
ncbi:MAG: hypothetical protein AAGJ84_02340 [Pseudomonadota bacterium]